jgi:50S ribosomal protein L16 3-hydroxylase
VAPEDESWIDDRDVRILSEFTPDETWTLNPGDVLYLPPRIPHHGIARNDCMTYSIGCRAATHRQLLLGWMEYLSGTLDPNRRYSDPDLSPRTSPGRITSDDLERIRSIIDNMLDHRNELERWFGEFVTEPSRGGTSMPPERELSPKDVASRIREGAGLRRSEASRFSYFDEPTGEPLLFVDGSSYTMPPGRADLAQLLSDHASLSSDQLRPFLQHPKCVKLLASLYNEGHLYFP